MTRRTHLTHGTLGLVVLLTLAGCSPATHDVEPVTTTATVKETETETETTPVTTTHLVTPSMEATEGTTMMGTADTADKRSAPQAYELVVTDVRVGEHDGFDRVVFEFGGTGIPGWNMGLHEGPVHQASGYPVEYAGDTALDVHLHGLDMTVHPPSGAMDIGEVAGPHGAVTGVQLTTIFEAVGQYVIGLNGGPRPYSVTLLENPTRLVIDIQHP